MKSFELTKARVSDPNVNIFLIPFYKHKGIAINAVITILIKQNLNYMLLQKRISYHAFLKMQYAACR